MGKIERIQVPPEDRERLEKLGLSAKYESVQQFTDLVRKHLSVFLQDYVST